MSQKILLGTYTRRESKGIYSVELETEHDDLRNLKLETDEVSPTYLAEDHNGRIYSVTSLDEKGGAASYSKDFDLINTVTKEGAPLCYVAVDEKRNLLYGANYHDGEVSVYKISDDGSIKQTDLIVHDEPTGPHQNQDNPHAHYADLTPDNRLAVCDLGTDRVYTYDVSDEGGLIERNVYKAADGTGPRHLVFRPDGRFAYLIGELDSSITVLSYDTSNGQFTQIEKFSILPDDYTDFNAGAAIRISPDGRFVYLSNRGHNSIAVFSIQEKSGTVSFVERVSTEGKIPRDFNIDPTGKYVVAANLDTDNLTLYKRDAESGSLTLLKKDIFAPEVVCVLFTTQ